MLGSCINVTTNVNGIPYINSIGSTVGTEYVDYALGFRRIPPVGYFTISLDALPTGTTGTLPVRFTLNGNTRPLTYFGGSAVTAADLEAGGVITVFYNWYSGTLQIISPISA